MSTQVRFTLALNATWSVLRDPVLTKMYSRQWKRYVTRVSNPIAERERYLCARVAEGVQCSGREMRFILRPIAYTH